MAHSERAILVVDTSEAQASNLKELIEFMDTPTVCAATPATWREQLGDRRLEALFLGPDVAPDAADSVLSSVAALDPNIPIVLLRERVTS